jgi:hypothetical protein
MEGEKECHQAQQACLHNHLTTVFSSHFDGMLFNPLDFLYPFYFTKKGNQGSSLQIREIRLSSKS